MGEPPEMTEARREQAALDYAGRGWSVVPIEPGGKRPLVRWEELQQRRASPAELHDWLARWPDANVGIVTGSISGLLVLDVDPRHDGSESLAALEAEHGALPATVEALTGGGGRHLYFAHPGGVLRNRVGLRPGIDLRGDAGLVVAPPSRHASGRSYRWREGHAPGDLPLAALPDWLLHPAGASRGTGHPLPWWRERARELVREGERNSRLASFAGHLLWHGVDPEVATELLLCWNRLHCEPPLSDEEVVRTVESITRTHRRHEPEGGGG